MAACVTAGSMCRRRAGLGRSFGRTSHGRASRTVAPSCGERRSRSGARAQSRMMHRRAVRSHPQDRGAPRPTRRLSRLRRHDEHPRPAAIPPRAGLVDPVISAAGLIGPCSDRAGRCAVKSVFRLYLQAARGVERGCCRRRRSGGSCRPRMPGRLSIFTIISRPPSVTMYTSAYSPRFSTSSIGAEIRALAAVVDFRCSGRMPTCRPWDRSSATWRPRGTGLPIENSFSASR